MDSGALHATMLAVLVMLRRPHQPHGPLPKADYVVVCSR